jgi:hypothetical protein
MSTDDTKRLERVEQYWLNRTRPNPGRSRSVRPADLQQEGKGKQEGQR